MKFAYLRSDYCTQINVLIFMEQHFFSIKPVNRVKCSILSILIIIILSYFKIKLSYLCHH